MKLICPECGAEIKTCEMCNQIFEEIIKTYSFLNKKHKSKIKR